jgi:hypothetical protein
MKPDLLSSFVALGVKSPPDLQLLAGRLVKCFLGRLKLDDQVKDGAQLGQDILQNQVKKKKNQGTV